VGTSDGKGGRPGKSDSVFGNMLLSEFRVLLKVRGFLRFRKATARGSRALYGGVMRGMELGARHVEMRRSGIPSNLRNSCC
jgi:hypothetical protein